MLVPAALVMPDGDKLTRRSRDPANAHLKSANPQPEMGHGRGFASIIKLRRCNN
jgi:hypothetical protein